jgi:tetratricopeptide (TPR) repeat protein
MANGTQNPIAYSHYQTGRELFRTYGRQAIASAKSEFAEAIAVDPTFARAYGWLAYVHLEEVQEGWSEDPEASFISAVNLANKGVELGEHDYYNHWNLAAVLTGTADFDSANQSFDKALALNSSDPDLLADLADKCSYEGDPDKAIGLMQQAFDLKIPQWYHWSLGFAYFQKRQYADALAALEKMTNPPNTAYLLMIACKVKLEEEIPSPDDILERLKSRDPEWTSDHLSSFPFKKSEDNDHYVGALTEAGVV